MGTKNKPKQPKIIRLNLKFIKLSHDLAKQNLSEAEWKKKLLQGSKKYR